MLQATSMTYRLIRLRSLRFEALAQSIHLARRSLELRRAGLELRGPHLDDTPNVLGFLIESFSPPPDVSHARTSEPLTLAYARGANDDTGKGSARSSVARCALFALLLRLAHRHGLLESLRCNTADHRRLANEKLHRDAYVGAASSAWGRT